MEGNRIDILITELIELDPNLKQHETELRALVSTLMEKRPSVTIDASFKAKLRERILTQSIRAIPSPYAELSWWAMRLVPLGAVALLLITLVPGDILQTPTSLEESSIAQDGDMDERDSRILRVESGDAPSGPAPAFHGGMGGGSGVADDASMESSMSMKMAADTVPAPMTIAPQLPGTSITVDTVTVTNPSFIVVRSYRNDGSEYVVGISPLIMPGTTENVPVYLHEKTHVGQYYMATVYIDNGNRVFTDGEDVPMVDSYGNPVSVGFDIVSGYFE